MGMSETERPVNVEQWMESGAAERVLAVGESDVAHILADGRFDTMMARVARFHDKHDFANPDNNGHDMGYRLALVIEELGELSAAITKAKPHEEAAEELADVFILMLGNALAMEVDLEAAFHAKMDRIMKRESRRGNLGIRVTEYKQD
jgi:NTP pyrophosphatase (non-canonical NTP hydrolase)